MFTNKQKFEQNMETLRKTGKVIGIDLGKENSKEVESRQHNVAAGKGLHAAKMLNNRVYHFR